MKKNKSLPIRQTKYHFLKYACVFLILNVINIYGQSGFSGEVDFDNMQFKHLTSDQGLAHNRVLSVIMDDQEYMWFGTQDGLSRWDGSSVKTYYPRLGDSTAISGSLITGLAKDKNGHLWIVSHQGDICRYDPSTDLFKTYQYPSFEDGVVLTSEMEVIIDSDDIIWIGCFDDGFVRFDPDAQTFKRFDVAKDLTKDDDRVRKNSVLVIKEDKFDKNNLWLGTNNGLHSFNKISEEVTAHSMVSVPGGAPALRAILMEDAETVWVATLGSGIGEYNRTLDTWNFHVPDPDMWLTSNFSVNYINDIAYKSASEFWISSGEFGSGVFNIDTKEFKFFEIEPNSSTSISSNKGYLVYADPKGRMWWIHSDYGVSYMESECQIFHFNDFGIPGGESSWSRFLSDITYDPTRNKIYGVGHVLDGLFEINHPEGDVQQIPMYGFDKNMSTYNAVLYTSYNTLLVGGFHSATASYGEYIHSPLLYLDKEINKLKPYRPEIFEALQSKNINDIIEDSNHIIWISTDDGYLFRYDHSSKKVNTFYMDTRQGTGINYIVESLKHNLLYFATFDGIHSFNLSDNSFNLLNGTQEFSSRGIALSKDENLLWIGTRQLGVQGYDISSNSLIRLNEYRNAPRTPVEKVFLDKEDRLWATTERGLFLLNQELKSFYDFSTKNGISQDFFYSQGVYVLNDGTVMMGQQGGYYYFHPSDLMSSLSSAPAVITEVLVNQREAYKLRDEDGVLNFKLPYNQNSVSIGFSSVSYCQQDKVQFTYMLDGLEEDWLIPLQNTRTINYPSLSSGTYTFKVKKVEDKDENAAVMNIRITPPFWRSWLAYLIYGMVFLYGINWVYSIKLRRQEEKEALRLKISSDIHDDVGSLLTGLAMQSETMAIGKEGEEKENLLNISDTGREAIDRLRDIVWALDSRRDKFENLIDRMKFFADNKFRKTNFDYKFTTTGTDAKRYIKPNYRQNIFLLFKEAITNLIKHSNGNEAQITFSISKKFIRLSIYDNGTSSEIQKSEGVGLSNMKMRAEKIGGSLIINRNAGFEVILEVSL